MFYYSTGYYWKVVTRKTACTKEEYEAANDAANVNVPIYPPVPSAEFVGQKYGYRSAHLQRSIFDLWDLPGEYNLIEWWLECSPL